MKDILGREIKVGDIVAHGQRSGNGGSISVKVVTEIAKRKPDRWSYETEQIKVTNYRYVTSEYNKETKSWNDVRPYYEKGGAGWTDGDRIVILSEPVPDELHYFLKSIV